MSRLSISRAWDDTRAIMGRDGKLLATVAAALFVLPGIIAQVVQPVVPQGEFAPLGYWSAISAIAFLISMIGALALIRLALGRGQSVGDAIRHGARRAPAYIAATVLWAVPLAIAGLLVLSAGGADPENPSLGAALGLLVVATLALFVIIRMAFSSSVSAAEEAGPVEVLKRSWELTRGNWWRLFALFLLVGIAAGLLLMVVQAVVGSFATVVLGEPEPLSLSRLVVAIFYQVVSAAFSVLFNVMLARLYLQATGPATSEVEDVFR